MEANPFATARGHLSPSPLARWGALLASVAAGVCLVLLLPVLYLFIDLLSWRGAMPSYASLTALRQEQFRQEWEGGLGENEKVKANLDLIRLPGWDQSAGDAARWEWRWQAASYTAITDKVGYEAADAYLPGVLMKRLDIGEGIVVTPTADRMGVLSLLARERPRWTTNLLGAFARAGDWTWRPNPDTGANTAYLSGLFLIAFLLAAAHVILLLTAEYLAARAALDAVARVRRNLFNHANRLGVLAVRPQAAADAAELFTRKVDALQEGLRAYLLYGWRTPVVVVLLLALVLCVNVWAGLCVLLAGAVAWVFGGQTAAWLRRDARRASRRSDARRAQLRESVTTLHLVKSYLMERFSQTRVERILADHGRAEWRRLRGEALARPALIAAGMLAAVGVLFVAGRAVLVGDMSLAGLVMKVAAVAPLAASLGAWIDARLRGGRAAEAAAAVAEFLDRRTDPGQPIDAKFLQPMRKRLELHEVSYREPGTGRMLLDGVSAVMPSGSRVAVVGSDPDAVGAVAHLLTRFVDPTGGEVRIDGENTRWVTHESVRTQVALVSKRNLVFSDTAANNIGCGESGFSLPQIIEAAKAAHAHGFIQRLPYGYETLIGDAGQALTPGEQLRVALARAVLRDPSVLVIEEPTEPMDDDSRALLDDSYTRLGANRTLVFLSARQAVLRKADRVLMLHDGQLAAAGTHEELMRESEIYRHLLFRELPTPVGA